MADFFVTEELRLVYSFRINPIWIFYSTKNWPDFPGFYLDNMKKEEVSGKLDKLLG